MKPTVQKKSKFSRYYLKYTVHRGKRDTVLHKIFRVVFRFPRYISCYIAENRLPLGQCMDVTELTCRQLPAGARPGPGGQASQGQAHQDPAVQEQHVQGIQKT